MFKFRQSVHQKVYDGFCGEFYAKTISFAGTRIENKNKIYLESEDSSSNFKVFDVCPPLVENLHLALVSIYKYFEKFGVNVLYNIIIHNEHVLINDAIEDDRHYKFCRVVFVDSNNVKYMEEFPLSDDFYNEIEIIKNKYLFLLYKNTSTQRDFSLKSYPLIFSPQATGYFTHEIIGHLLEEDVLFNEYFKINYNLIKTNKNFVVVDSIQDEISKNLLGLSKYDDLGTAIRPITLISDGKINNTIATSKKCSMDKSLYGFARRQNYKYSTLPRMRSTYTKPLGNLNSDQIIAKHKHAFYLDKIYSGNLSPITQDYSLTGIGYMVENGEVCNQICTFNLTSNVIDSLEAITYVGNDFDLISSNCIKGDQSVRVCMGGPTISLLNNNIINGKKYE